MCKATGASESSFMCLAWQVPGEATGDEDELGLAPVYKGSCVAKMLAREPGDEGKQRDLYVRRKQRKTHEIISDCPGKKDYLCRSK